MEAIILDVPAVKRIIKESMNRLYPEFEVIIHDDDTDDTALTICPPPSYVTDISVDIFISGAGLEFHMDVERVSFLPLSVDSDDVARLAKGLLDEEEAARQG